MARKKNAFVLDATVARLNLGHANYNLISFIQNSRHTPNPKRNKDKMHAIPAGPQDATIGPSFDNTHSADSITRLLERKNSLVSDVDARSPIQLIFERMRILLREGSSSHESIGIALCDAPHYPTDKSNRGGSVGSVRGRNGYGPLLGYRLLEGGCLSDETEDLRRKARHHISAPETMLEYGA
jgi:hypothetical protein